MMKITGFAQAASGPDTYYGSKRRMDPALNVIAVVITRHKGVSV
ncbi:MAG: hypothetical protein ABFC78_01050 [Methanoregula sp.]